MFWNKKKTCILAPSKKKATEAYERTMTDLHNKTQQLDLRKHKLDELLHNMKTEGHTP